ncbi:MAG: PspC domain-containing protein [Candidatus Hydrothermae bacterium]|nr:PspC domain-containing protein [Candidatus Hydrothermae bacterium]
MQRLRRSKKDRMIGGVCGGLGEYFHIDPVIIRLIFVLLLFANGIGLLAYILFWIIVPEESPEGEGVQFKEEEDMARAARSNLWGGAILIIIGLYFLLRNMGFLGGLDFALVWPAILIIIGLFLLFRRK